VPETVFAQASGADVAGKGERKAELDIEPAVAHARASQPVGREVLG